jgi:hypothetical protein
MLFKPTHEISIFTSSFPRKRESRNVHSGAERAADQNLPLEGGLPCGASRRKVRFWIPAFAGMTGVPKGAFLDFRLSRGMTGVPKGLSLDSRLSSGWWLFLDAPLK